MLSGLPSRNNGTINYNYLLVVIGGGIADLVLLIIMMVNYYKGTTTGEFLDYYQDCLPDEYKNEDLKQVYKNLDEIDYNMTVLVVMNFVGMFLNYVGSCFTNKKRKEIKIIINNKKTEIYRLLNLFQVK